MFFGGNCGCGYTQVESYPTGGGCGIGNFALIVVLFILLIIVGAAYYC